MSSYTSVRHSNIQIRSFNDNNRTERKQDLDRTETLFPELTSTVIIVVIRYQLFQNIQIHSICYQSSSRQKLCASRPFISPVFSYVNVDSDKPSITPLFPFLTCSSSSRQSLRWRISVPCVINDSGSFGRHFMVGRRCQRYNLLCFYALFSLYKLVIYR